MGVQYRIDDAKEAMNRDANIQDHQLHNRVSRIKAA